MGRNSETWSDSSSEEHASERSTGSPTNVSTNVHATSNRGQSEVPIPGQKVDAEVARTCMRNKMRVCTTTSYRARLPQDGDGDLSAGREGVIMKLELQDDGYVCDVLWAHGKAFRGYCVGYRGYNDLEIAPAKTRPLQRQTSGALQQHAQLLSPTGSDCSAGSPRPDICAEGTKAGCLPASVSGDAPAEIGVTVGYLHSAPSVNHAGGKHIWSCSGPMSYN